LPIGIAEKEEEKRAQDEERDRPGATEPQTHRNGDHEGAEDKGPPGPVETHLLILR
jgi:hypothetical protein